MPACIKWRELDGYSIPIDENFRKYDTLSGRLDYKVTQYIIEDVFEQMVENIKWFNKINEN